MTNEQDFESTVRGALHDVAVATPPAAGLADRLIANASRSGAAVPPLRRSRRYTVPLLAAAVCILLIVGIVLGNHFLSSGRSTTPPATVQPTPTHSVASTGSRDTPSTATGSTATSVSRTTTVRSTSGRTTAPDTKASNPPWLTALPASTGAPSGFHASSLDFSDINTGWVIGDAQCPSSDQTGCPALIHTTDGGKTWKQLSVPKGLSSATVGKGCAVGDSDASPCVDRVTFAKERVGYLWGTNRTYLTIDGGSSWTTVPHSQGTFSFVAFGDRALWIRNPSGDLTSSTLPNIESAPLGSTAFTQVAFPGVLGDHYGGDLMLVPAGKHALFAIRTSGPRSQQVMRSVDGSSWQQWASGDLCGGGLIGGPFPAAAPIGALDGSLLIGCSGSKGDYLKVAAAGSKTFGPLRKLPAVDPSAGTSSIYVAAARSSTDFSVAVLSPDGPAYRTHWYRTRDGAASWAAPLEFPDAFPEQAGSQVGAVAPL
ncbi:MAG: WD40/YVTN/BNR-like repeat-containing protein, partial [Nakamurella sp.]